jgi:hypothetical protein
MSALASPIDRLRELGGSLWLEGETLRYRIPAGNPEAHEVLADLRRNREALRAMLQDQESMAPSVNEVTSTLPSGVRLVSYQPKRAPFAVATVSIVTNAGKFYRTYLSDLARLLAQPRTGSCPPLADILGKLADAGQDLKVETGA